MTAGTPEPPDPFVELADAWQALADACRKAIEETFDKPLTVLSRWLDGR